MGKLTIITPGPLTTVQDGGRYGYMKDGFTASGAADKLAAATANLLCGNDRGAALLEMTLMGATVEFDSHAVIAVTGADMSPTLNGSPIEGYAAIEVKPGDRLVCGFAAVGCRGYLAVSGGIDVPEVMGSRATALKYGVGGFEGRKLKSGDVLTHFDHAKLDKLTARSDKRKSDRPELSTPTILRAVLGPQDGMFTDGAKSTLTSTEYTVTPDSDRMGIRLDGSPLETHAGSDIISDGIVCGCIQVPKSGMPIILGADCQTTGGYAKIATVCSFDMSKAAQLKPGDKLRFELVTVEESQKLCKAQAKELDRLAKKMRV